MIVSKEMDGNVLDDAKISESCQISNQDIFLFLVFHAVDGGLVFSASYITISSHLPRETEVIQNLIYFVSHVHRWQGRGFFGLQSIDLVLYFAPDIYLLGL